MPAADHRDNALEGAAVVVRATAVVVDTDARRGERIARRIVGRLGHRAILAHVRVADLPTPALVVDTGALTRNLDTMTAALPGARLRPHVKAHKCTALAREQALRGHGGFTGATPRELLGLAREGLGDDLLLANQSVDDDRLRTLATSGARITVAVDSEATIDAAVRAGIGEVLIDVNVGMPRCGVPAGVAGALAEIARARGLGVRGTMGYEGHAVGVVDRAERRKLTQHAMEILAGAADAVGGEIVSAGGTGTYDINETATEIQAGSYALMDTAYAELGLPFEHALSIVATVIHTNPEWSVADCGLKALAMDHGNPTITDARVLFCSDEHVTFTPEARLAVGDRVLVRPAHVDPTVAYHEVLHLADGRGIDAEIVDGWAVDLRGWNDGE
jgi:D-serine deaminase-like pyridoxal phosphate-dependent protein